MFKLEEGKVCSRNMFSTQSTVIAILTSELLQLLDKDCRGRARTFHHGENILSQQLVERGGVSFLSDVATGKSAHSPVNDLPLTHMLATQIMLSGSHTKRRGKSRGEILEKKKTFSASREEG